MGLHGLSRAPWAPVVSEVTAFESKTNAEARSSGSQANAMANKKLSYPQRKCASNVAILYGAGDGIQYETV